MRFSFISSPVLFRRIVPFLIIPTLVISITLYMRLCSGPYWLATNLDPNYANFTNGLNILRGHPIGHYDQPGTPTQVFSSVVMLGTHLIWGQSDLSTDILSHSDQYMRDINNGILFIYMAISVLLGMTVFHVTGSFALALLVQGTPIYSRLLPSMLWWISPEPFLELVSLMLVCLCMMTIKYPIEDHPKKYSIAFGIITALGIATKFTFVAMALIPLIILPSIPLRIYFTVSTVLGFVFFTVPALPLYPKMFRWIVRVARHTSPYGTGSVGLFDLSALRSNLQACAVHAPIAVISTFLSIGTILTALVDGAKQRKSKALLLLVAVTTAQLAGIAIAVKGSSTRYLVPVASLVGFQLFLLINVWPKLSYFSSIPLRKARMIFLLCLVLLVGTENILLFQRIGRNREIADKSLQVYHTAETKYQLCRKIYVFKASSPIYALAVSNSWARYAHTQPLESIFGKQYLYSFRDQLFQGFAGPISESEVAQELKNERCSVFQGLGLSTNDRLPAGLILSGHDGNDLESILSTHP